MAVRDDFAAGEVLAAADLNDTFASKVDYALPVNAQTGTTYTFVAADAEKLTTASNGSAVTLTIPPASSVAWPDNTVLRVVNYGAGAVTIDGGSGVTVTNTSSTIAQYGAAVAIRTGSDAWTVVPFGGGDIPAATVSSPSATGQYTDAGITYDYYTFTASGTLTVDTAGFADVLVVGGGGGGGWRYSGPGAGAGGVLIASDFFVPQGTYTVTVGAGGAGNSTGNSDANAGASSVIVGLPLAGVGGGGGTDGGSGGCHGRQGGSGSGGLTGNSVGFGVPGQGNQGGVGANGGSGGGAGAAGVGQASTSVGEDGGDGVAVAYTGSSVYYGGGGGSGVQSGTAGSGGLGGGGNGSNSNTTAGAGTANTGGGGGGGGGTSGAGGNGGSGIVIVRVKV